ncbi:MAG TPA: hypothetical protein VGM23_08530 [Armatimonadota bacterium]
MALHLNRGSVDIHVTNLDVRQALDELFLQMGVKYELPPEVQGTVTLDLHNASYEDALTAMLDPIYTYDVGPHDTVYVHCAGTGWKPGNENID